MQSYYSSLDRHKLLSMAKKTVKAEEALKARCVYPWDSTSRKFTLAPIYCGSGPPGTAAHLWLILMESKFEIHSSNEFMYTSYDS